MGREPLSAPQSHPAPGPGPRRSLSVRGRAASAGGSAHAAGPEPRAGAAPNQRGAGPRRGEQLPRSCGAPSALGLTAGSEARAGPFPPRWWRSQTGLVRGYPALSQAAGDRVRGPGLRDHLRWSYILACGPCQMEPGGVGKRKKDSWRGQDPYTASRLHVSLTRVSSGRAAGLFCLLLYPHCIPGA